MTPLFATLDPYILAFSAATVIATIWMGFWAARRSKTASDFYVAGRSVSVGWNASAISGEYLSAASFMGVAGMVMSVGYDALWYPVCYACGYLFLLLFIAGPLRRFGAYTVPDLAEGRFDSPMFRKIAVVFVLFIGFFYTMPQMKGAGTTLAYIFPGLPYWAGVVVVGAIITLNVALGGMKGITLVQAFQYWAKMFAISVPIFVLMAVYGHYGKQLGRNGEEFKTIYQPPSKLEIDARDAVGEKIADAVHLDRPDYNAFRSEWLTHLGLLKNYGLFQGKSVEVSAPGRNLYETFPFTTNWVSASNFCELAQPLFAKYGFKILKEDEHEVRFASFLQPTTVGPADYSKIEDEWRSEGWEIGDAVTNATFQIHQYEGDVRPLFTYSIRQFFAGPRIESVRNPLLEKAAAVQKGAFHAESFTNLLTKQTWSETYGGVIDEIAIKASRIGLGLAAERLPFPECRLFIAINWYQHYRPGISSSGSMWLDKDLGSYPSLSYRKIDTTVVPPLTNATAPRAFRLYLERLLEANGIAVVRADTGAAAFILSRNLSKFGLASTGLASAGDAIEDVQRQDQVADGSLRKPLPDKAPADSTWLSPFGPLTTKAAKAAATAIGKSRAKALGPAEAWRTASGSTGAVSVSTSMTLSVVNGWVTLTAPSDLTQVEDRLRAVFGQARHYSVGNAKLVSVLLEYSRLTGQTVSVHTNVGLTRLLGSLELDWNKRATLLSDLEQFLGTNGVALRREELGTVRAMTPEQAERWDHPANSPAVGDAAKTAEKAWLAEHEKPLALLYTYSLIIALVCGTAGLPHILVRFYTNPNGVAAKRTTMWVMILIGVFYVFPPVFGVMGRNLLPGLYSGIGAMGTDKIVLELPRLLNERFAPLGSILSGVTCAGAFAAFMSTFSGLLVSMTGAMAHDVYGRMLNPKASAEQRLRAFKIAAVGIGVIAILLGMQVEALEINFMVGQAFAIAAASYFPFLFMCAWWRNLTMKGAATGMLTGGLLALGGITLTSISDIALKTSVAKSTPNPLQELQDFWAGHPGVRIICEQPAIWAVPLAIVLMLIVSKLTRKEVPSDIRMKMLVLHAPEKLGLKQEYIQEHQHGH